MLGVSAILFTAFCIGESMYNSMKKREPEKPQFRVITGPNGSQILQKRIIAHGHGHGHGHHDSVPVSVSYNRAKDLSGLSVQLMALDDDEYDELLEEPLPEGTDMDPEGLSIGIMSMDEDDE